MCEGVGCAETACGGAALECPGTGACEDVGWDEGQGNVWSVAQCVVAGCPGVACHGADCAVPVRDAAGVADDVPGECACDGIGCVWSAAADIGAVVVACGGPGYAEEAGVEFPSRGHLGFEGVEGADVCAEAADLGAAVVAFGAAGGANADSPADDWFAHGGEPVDWFVADCDVGFEDAARAAATIAAASAGVSGVGCVGFGCAADSAAARSSAASMRANASAPDRRGERVLPAGGFGALAAGPPVGAGPGALGAWLPLGAWSLLDAWPLPGAWLRLGPWLLPGAWLPPDAWPPLDVGPLAAAAGVGRLRSPAPLLVAGSSLDPRRPLASRPVVAPGAGLRTPAPLLVGAPSLSLGRRLATGLSLGPGLPFDIGSSAGVKSSLRLPRLSEVARLSCDSRVHTTWFARASGVLVAVARAACAFPASGEDCEDSACDAAVEIDAVGTGGETFSKSNVSVSLSAASNSSMTSRIVRGRRLGSFANICITSAPSKGGICRVGTRVGTRSSMARFLSKWG